MAYSGLPAHVANDIFALGDYDKIKGNFEAGAPHNFTTKGDLFPATGNQAGARLGVGANRSILVADSTQTTGLRWQIVPSARVYNSAGLSPTNDAYNLLTFDSERWDTDGCHSTVSNTSRLTVPSGGAGIYTIGASVKMGTSLNQICGAEILLNGTTVIARDEDQDSTGGAFTFTPNTVYSLAAGDYVEVRVYIDNGTVAQAGNYTPEFWFAWIQPAP